MSALSATNMPLPPLEDTGERMMPETSGEDTFWEHVYRYAFACRFITGKRVLDIACGEGYGTAALQKAGAASVIGIDVSPETCEHARQKYGVDAHCGSAEKIPLPNSSIDVIVSFETIEHLRNPLLFLDECARILTPGGRLIISTPNKGLYRAEEDPNPFHLSEMTESEFASALRRRFHRIKLHSQHPRFAPRWSLRALAADVTPWQGNPRFERIRRSARFRFAPHLVYEFTNEQRLSVVDQILRAREKQRAFVNTHGVGPRRKWDGEKPAYIIATATRKRNP